MYTKHLVRGMGVLVQDGVRWNRENDWSFDNGWELGLRLLSIDEAVAMERVQNNEQHINAILTGWASKEKQRKPRTWWWQRSGHKQWVQ